MMFNDFECCEKNQLEIVYDVQWKTPGNDDDKAKIIGIVDTPDTNLDWNSFKSYLIQNSGNMRFTTDDIRISYLDSDDDLIPVDSELEFRECLKFSRIRARKGRKIVMKVSMISNGGAKPKNHSKYPIESGSVNPKLFCLKKKDITQMRKPTVSFEKAEKSSETEFDKSVVPGWFEAYMTKFKSELIQEITSAVVTNVRSSLCSNNPASTSGHLRSRNSGDLPQQSSEPSSSSKGHHHHYPLHVLEKRKKKKKMPEEDSSDCTENLQLQWEERLELLRHMQKINKREKKFEKKLEKLECKTKKIIEKKHSLWGSKKATGIPLPAHGLPQSSAPLEPSAPSPYTSNLSAGQCMNATPVEEFNFVPHVGRGELVSQVWTVRNNGQRPWTDQTELRFAWGSKSLVPLTTAVKCPLLKPGQSGQVRVALRAPLFPGNFESYWHFHHHGRRFGHWLGCAVIVDPEPMPGSPCHTNKQPEIKSDEIFQNDQGPLPVDLTMKCQQQSYSDDMKIYNNIETTKPEAAPVQESVNLLQSTSPIKSGVKSNEEILVVDGSNSGKLESAGVYLRSFLSGQEVTPPPPPPPINIQSPIKCILDSELNDYPHFESYSSLSKPELLCYITDTYPDLVQRNDDTLQFAKPDLNAWVNYSSEVDNSGLTTDSVGEQQTEMNQQQVDDKQEKADVLERNLDKDETEDKYEKVLTGVENMCIKDEEGKMNNDQQICDEDDNNDEEYILGSDSDNISIISGTISIDTDDTEPSDEFVVVPMPTCVNCEYDQTNEIQQVNNDDDDTLPVTAPISVEIPKTPSDSDISAHAVQASDNNNNMEDLQPFPEMPQLYLPVLVTGDCSSSSGVSTDFSAQQQQQQRQDSMITHASYLCMKNKEEMEQQQQQQRENESDDLNTVYVRDESGKSIPVAKVISTQQEKQPNSSSSSNQSEETSSTTNNCYSSASVNVATHIGVIKHTTFGDPNFGQGPNGPRFPFSGDVPNSPPLCHNPGGPCNMRPQHESPINRVHPPDVEPNQFFNYQQKLPQQPPRLIRYTSMKQPKLFQHPLQQQQQQQSEIGQQQQQQQVFRKKCSNPTTHTNRQDSRVYYPFDAMYQAQEMAGTAAGIKRNSYPNIHTEQPRACKFSYVYNNGSKETVTSKENLSNSSARSSSSSRRTSSDTRETSPVAAAVQILPETLVSGAVNVASSAINTARSVIDMLRPRHDEPLVAQWDTPIPPSMETSLRTLNEMGFNNRELNIMLLKQHNNDVARVISELVQ